MQSEEMDNRIREAAENHHPAYNENAWPDMEKLLDKHLPQQKNDRRRYVFFLLLFLLAGSGAWLVISKPWKKKPVAVLTDTKAGGKQAVAPAATKAVDAGTGNSTTPGIETPATNAIPGTAATATPAGDVTGIDNNKDISNNTTTAVPVTAASNKEQHSRTQPQTQRKDIQDSQLEMLTTAGNKKKKAASKSAPIKETPADLPATVATALQPDQPVNKSTPPAAKTSDAKNETIAATGSNNDKRGSEVPATTIATAGETAAVPANPEKKTDASKENTTAKTKKQPGKKGNSLAITFSAGPDVSMIRFDKAGKMQTILGAGLSYTFRNKLTISTGVYTARKIYTAAPSDYKFAYTPPNYNYMTKIDGNCKVLAIPVNISMSFGKSKKGNWYAGTGLTSLLMKTEKYDYEYQYPSGSSYTYTSNHSNENKHLFSILNISGGYRRNLNKSVFIAAEPYLQLPLNSGVGAGKVKMNSTGILFTIGVKPFNR